MADTPYKEIARLLLQGMCLQMNSPETENKPIEDYYEEITKDSYHAQILALFGHWCNDLSSVFGTAPDIRLTIELRGDTWVIEDVPPLPEGLDLDDYFWYSGRYEWSVPEGDDLWVHGSWQPRDLDDFMADLPRVTPDDVEKRWLDAMEAFTGIRPEKPTFLTRDRKVVRLSEAPKDQVAMDADYLSTLKPGDIYSPPYLRDEL